MIEGLDPIDAMLHRLEALGLVRKDRLVDRHNHRRRLIFPAGSLGQSAALTVAESLF